MLSFFPRGVLDEILNLIESVSEIFLPTLPYPGQETEAKMVWPCLEVFWFSKDNPIGHSSRKKKKKEADRRRGSKTISKSGQEWTLPAQLGQLKTGQNRKGLLRIHLWCPDDLPRLWDRIE